MVEPEEDVAAEVAEEAVEAEGSEELVTVVIEEMGKIKVSQARVKVRVKGIMGTPGTRRPGTPTCPHSNPVFAIGPMGSLLIFVWSQGPVPGSSTGCQSPTINEIPTSSITSMTMKILKIYSIRLHFPK